MSVILNRMKLRNVGFTQHLSTMEQLELQFGGGIAQ